MKSTLSDTDLSRQNKATVQHFHDVVFNQRRASAAVEFIREDYVQHSPYLADGREPFIDYFGTLFTEYPNSRIDVKRLVAEGDYVVVHSHFARWPSDRGTAMVDIYRLEGGRLAEHWDVTEDVPERAANRNTMCVKPGNDFGRAGLRLFAASSCGHRPPGVPSQRSATLRFLVFAPGIASV